jgi:hypothetical protein
MDIFIFHKMHQEHLWKKNTFISGAAVAMAAAVAAATVVAESIPLGEGLAS